MKPARGTRADNMWSTYRFVDTWMCTVSSNFALNASVTLV